MSNRMKREHCFGTYGEFYAMDSRACPGSAREINGFTLEIISQEHSLFSSQDLIYLSHPSRGLFRHYDPVTRYIRRIY